MISSATYRVIVFCEGQQVLILCFVLCACLTYKRTRLSCDDECFRNGLVHEFHSLKSLKTLKEVNTSDVEKIKNVTEQNFDVEQITTSKSSCLINKRVRSIVFNILILLFRGLNSCKERLYDCMNKIIASFFITLPNPGPNEARVNA